MFINIKIKKKLMTAFIIISILAGISGIVSAGIIKSVNKEYSYAIKNYGFAQGDVGKLLSCLGVVNVSAHDTINYLDLTEQNSAQQKFQTQAEQIDKYFSTVEGTLQSQEVKDYFGAAKNAWQKYFPLAEELMKQGYTEDAEKVRQLQKRIVNELDPLYEEIYNSLWKVMENKVESGNNLETELTRSINRSNLFLLVMIIIIFIVSFFLGNAISKGIADPIHICAKRLRELAKGDLQSPVPHFHGKDEIGILAQSTNEIVSDLVTIIEDEKYLLEEMAQGNFNVYSRVPEKYVGDFNAVLEAIRTINYHLSDTLGQINESSDQVSSSSDQVSNAAQNLSQGASEQASAIEELAAIITNISEQISNNAENADVASQKAQAVGAEMTESNEKMQQMMRAMNEISDSSVEISKIIKTIEDIAFQTNILALNAAVEAARAGAAGKGFAVVADEVRNLASKSAEASKNTTQLIENSVKAVENGTQIAQATAKSLLTTVEGAEEVVHIIEKISKASSEQSESVIEVTKNIDQISNVVQTNSATAEESAAASEELFEQAQTLKTLIGRFRLRSKEDMRNKKGAPRSVLDKEAKMQNREVKKIIETEKY